MWTIFKVFIEFVTILVLIYVLVFWLCKSWLSNQRLDLHPAIGNMGS